MAGASSLGAAVAAPTAHSVNRSDTAMFLMLHARRTAPSVPAVQATERDDPAMTIPLVTEGVSLQADND